MIFAYKQSTLRQIINRLVRRPAKCVHLSKRHGAVFVVPFAGGADGAVCTSSESTGSFGSARGSGGSSCSGDTGGYCGTGGSGGACD